MGEPTPRQNFPTKLEWDVHTSPPHPPTPTMMCCHCSAAFGEEGGGGGWDKCHPQRHKFPAEHRRRRQEEGQGHDQGWHAQGGIGTAHTGHTGGPEQDEIEDGGHGHATNAGLAAAAAATTTTTAILIPKPAMAEPAP